jgi:rhodanese-related sulfurtransferase
MRFPFVAEGAIHRRAPSEKSSGHGREDPSTQIVRIDPPPGATMVGGMEHSPGFLKIVSETRPHVKEVNLDEARQRLAANPKAVLMDVREDIEWQNGHPAQAVHLGKGVFERDIEKLFPDPTTEIIMYCGGGYRSILTCDVAQRMGYKNVSSLMGGYKALVTANWPMVKQG